MVLSSTMENDSILIISSDADERYALLTTMMDAYQPLAAKDFEEGWNVLSTYEKRFEILLLDVQISAASIFSFLCRVREAGYTDLPVVLFCEPGNPIDEAEARNAGVWDFIKKPCPGEVLLRRVNAIVKQNQIAMRAGMKKMPLYDSLTGLRNHDWMFAQTKQMIEEFPESQFAFLRIDIDHFSSFNAAFGEEEGNKLICFLARSLREVFRPFARYKICRMNAEVFSVCCCHGGETQSLVSAVSELERKLRSFRPDYFLKLTVGAYEIKDRTQDVQDCYFRAATAARKCKNQNQIDVNLVFYDDAMGKQISNEVAITSEMEAALFRDEFDIYLQPKFRVRDERLCGAEALVRWNHPEWGLLSPGLFIPIFERNGFIDKLDCRICEKTCALLRRWKNEGKTPIPISVNISRMSFKYMQLVNFLKEVVQKYDISPSLLQLEITESAYMADPQLMESAVCTLRNAGFTILMDDFGSGYSSLNALKRIFIDVLKIDMKFLPLSEETERGEIILSNMVRMAKQLGMSVVTEGVETRRQRDFLEGVGCDSIQGFYYCRPIPVAEFEEKYDNLLTKIPNVAEKTENDEYKGSLMAVGITEKERAELDAAFAHQYAIDAFENGESALAAIEKNRKIFRAATKAILLYEPREGMSTLTFLKDCQVNPVSTAVPVMLIGSPSVDQEVAFFENGVSDCISRQASQEIIIARIRHIMTVSAMIHAADNGYAVLPPSDLDHATGLMNKCAFRQRCAHILVTSDLLSASFGNDGGNRQNDNALFIIDIDNFLKINEIHDRRTGDRVISHIAGQLKNLFRKTDVIAHMGEDEFAVLMTRIPNREAARRKAQDLIKNIHFTCNAQLKINVTISIGVAFSADGDTENTLIARADQALLEAKNTGRGKAVVYGEKVPPVADDGKPVVLICSQDPDLYPSIALAYGTGAAFAKAVSVPEMRSAFDKYGARIEAICLDMQNCILDNIAEFPAVLSSCEEKCGIADVWVLAFCQEGNMEQIRETLAIEAKDLLTMPPHMDAVQQALSRALSPAPAEEPV